MKIIKNNCYGGFSFSEAAQEWLKINKGWDKKKFDRMNRGIHKNIRTNGDLVECVETLGEKANGHCAELVIVEVPDDVKWEIRSYDGLETIAEVPPKKLREW